jgi:hypothetical protein
MPGNNPSGPISIGISSWLLGNVIEDLILFPPGEEGTHHKLPSSVQGRQLTILATLSLSSRSFRIVSIDIHIFIGVFVLFIVESLLSILGVYG